MAVNEKEFRRRLGAALREARLARQLTQSQLAETLDTDPETVSRFERGATLPSLVRLLGIADALGVTLGSLLSVASPRATDEWEELGRSLASLPSKDRALAAAIVKTIVLARAG